jgi:hypothetical protein
MNVSPSVAKLLAAAIAVAALVAAAFIKDTTVSHLLVAIASALVGKEFFSRTGDVMLTGVNVDDIGGGK